MQDYTTIDCPRCGGSGYISHFAHVEGGVCFYCRGKGHVSVPCVRQPAPEGKRVQIAGRPARVTRQGSWFRFDFETEPNQPRAQAWATVNEQGICGAAVLGANASELMSLAEFRAGVEAAYRGRNNTRVAG